MRLISVWGHKIRPRRFVDRAEFTARPDHLDLVREYTRVVQQKAALLRSGRVPAAELDDSTDPPGGLFNRSHFGSICTTF